MAISTETCTLPASSISRLESAVVGVGSDCSTDGEFCDFLQGVKEFMNGTGREVTVVLGACVSMTLGVLTTDEDLDVICADKG